MDGLWNVPMSSEFLFSCVLSSQQSFRSRSYRRRKSSSENPDKDPHQKWLSTWLIRLGPQIISQGIIIICLKLITSPRLLASRMSIFADFLFIVQVETDWLGTPGQIGKWWKHDEFWNVKFISGTTSWPGSMTVFRPSSAKSRSSAPEPPSVSLWTCSIQVNNNNKRLKIGVKSCFPGRKYYCESVDNHYWLRRHCLQKVYHDNNKCFIIIAPSVLRFRGHQANQVWYKIRTRIHSKF